MNIFQEWLEAAAYYINYALRIIFLLAIAAIGLFTCHPAFAATCADNDMQCWERLAKTEWRAEHGDWQPNLDTDTEKYLQKQTALLQEQRNGTQN